MGEWIGVKDRLPETDGDYLVVITAYPYRYIETMMFSPYLCGVDEYDFDGVNRPGWYYYDSEYGYVERDGITHWMPLPELPKEE